MMELNLKKPIVFFDLETTGLDLTQDRIVEIYALKIMPNQEQQSFHKLVNPSIPIPAETTKLHGISDVDVANAPSFKQIAKEFYRFILGCDLCGFNVIKFDIPMLIEEFGRIDIDFSIDKCRIIDSMVLFHLMEPRTLAGAYHFYCKKNLDNAHSAKADVIATYEILKAQVEMYNDKSVPSKIHPDKHFTIGNDMEQLHQISSEGIVDAPKRMIYNSKGEIVFNFGKYKGKVVEEVLRKDPHYYAWMMNANFSKHTKKKLTEIKLSIR